MIGRNPLTWKRRMPVSLCHLIIEVLYVLQETGISHICVDLVTKHDSDQKTWYSPLFYPFVH
jgi:hypothetical protein